MLDINAQEAESLAEEIMKILETAGPNMEGAMDRTGENIISRMKDYPPETAANLPHPPTYWVRGVGLHVYPSGRVIVPSQDMKNKWRKSISSSGDVVEMEVRNEATYSSYTHGLPSSEQARFHANRGWPPLPMVAAEEAGELPGGVSITYGGRTVQVSEFEKEAERIVQELEKI